MSNNAAPSRLARHLSVLDINRRCHRRGIRSSRARLRRSVPRKHRMLSGMSLGESGDRIPESILIRRPFNLHAQFRDGIFILSINIQCLLARLHELIHVLETVCRKYPYRRICYSVA